MPEVSPVLLDFPERFESERLVIRAPQPGDGRSVNEAIRESFEEIRKWLPWAKEKPSPEETEEHCRRSRAKFLIREDLQLLLFLKHSGEFIGASGLHRIDWSVPKFEIGYWCRSTRTGHGFITEGVSRIARFAFDELGAKRVEIHVDPKNFASCRIPERLGFQLDGVLRNHCRDPNGELRDTRVYSMLSLKEMKDNKQAQRS